MIESGASLQEINSILKHRMTGARVTKTIYVGNLEWKTTEEDLKAFFSSCGFVTSVEIIRHHDSGLSKGFAFITMENADQALKELNGKEFRGRCIKINEAREREKREYNPRAGDYKPKKHYEPLFNYREPEAAVKPRYRNPRRDQQQPLKRESLFDKNFNTKKVLEPYRKTYSKDFDKERQAYRRDYHF